MVQGELFREEDNRLEAASENKSFLSRTRVSFTLDKGLFGLIGLMAIFVLTYSFGVEQGKRAMEFQSKTLTSMPAQASPQKTLQSAPGDPQEGIVLMVDQTKGITSQARATEPEANEPVSREIPAKLAAAKSVPGGSYTVQLVTYKLEAQAQREIERLKTSGRNGFVIPSGRYYQVCADRFQTRGEAASALKRLRLENRYHDAFVRPVVR